MRHICFKGNEIGLEGSFLKLGQLAPDFALVDKDLKTETLASFKGKKKLLATVPSIDTPVCSEETKKLSQFAADFPEILILVISKDLPFAQKRFCLAEKIDNITLLSDMRATSDFGDNYGILIKTGPLAGLLARSVILLSESDKVIYSELVPEITTLPDFEAIRKSLK